LGAYARTIGGDLGASYQVKPSKPNKPPISKVNDNGDQELIDAAGK
jgi:hypothetical protein